MDGEAAIVILAARLLWICLCEEMIVKTNQCSFLSSSLGRKKEKLNKYVFLHSRVTQQR